MEFSFDVNPETDLALGLEVPVSEEVFEFEEDAFDITGYNPLTPTEAKPGSDDKVKMLAARYSAGVPLWHDSDCYDHGPGGAAEGALDDSAEIADVDDLEAEEE